MAKSDSSGQAGKGPGPREAFKRSAMLCSRQELSSDHIRDKLRRWGIAADTAEEIIDRLKKEDFLNDRRFATSYVRDKFQLNKWGRIKIGHMLRQKGIEPEVISEALETIREEEYVSVCTELIRKKAGMLKDRSLYARKGKLFRFAASRGFEPDLIHRILNKPLD